MWWRGALRCAHVIVMEGGYDDVERIGRWLPFGAHAFSLYVVGDDVSGIYIFYGFGGGFLLLFWFV